MRVCACACVRVRACACVRVIMLPFFNRTAVTRSSDKMKVPSSICLRRLAPDSVCGTCTTHRGVRWLLQSPLTKYFIFSYTPV